VKAEQADENRYRMGTAARLSGVSPATLRAWERRYQAVSPARSETGRRLYGDDDVARLQLMKALTDAGDPISGIASLEYEALRERLDRHLARPQPPDRAKQTLRRIALLDPDIEAQIRANPSDLEPLELVGADSSGGAYLERLPTLGADVLVMQLACMGPDPVSYVEACLEVSGARIVVVVYDFARADVLARLADRGVRLLKSPVRVSILRRTILDFIDVRRATAVQDALRAIEANAPTDLEQTAPRRRFSDADLARLQEITSSVDCECPSNLSAIIKSLVAFERYSHHCKRDNPRDAELHTALERGTAHARDVMERLLQRVCEHDGIDI
jgi:DNA-binding transcriptional MerR regulator